MQFDYLFPKHNVSSLIKIMDYLTKISPAKSVGKIIFKNHSKYIPKVCLSQLLQVSQCISWDVSLPLEISLSGVNHVPQFAVVVHVFHKCLNIIVLNEKS